MVGAGPQSHMVYKGVWKGKRFSRGPTDLIDSSFEALSLLEDDKVMRSGWSRWRVNHEPIVCLNLVKRRLKFGLRTQERIYHRIREEPPN